MNVKSVSEEPVVILDRWGILQEHVLGYRLVGIHAATGRARVTSPIIAYEGLTQTAETESGRIYHLRGEMNALVAAEIIYGHMRRWGLTPDVVALADPREVALTFASKPSGGWH